MRIYPINNYVMISDQLKVWPFDQLDQWLITEKVNSYVNQ